MTRHRHLRFAWTMALGLLCPAMCRPDPARITDPTRPVCELGRDYAILQWFTSKPAATRVQLRPGSAPAGTLGPNGAPTAPWANARVRVVQGTAGERMAHRLRIGGLEPGRRYSYRIYDPAADPTGGERRWGAEPPWRREYSFSTLAPVGRKTIVRIPIKVLLMPNVWNVASACATAPHAPPPALMSDREIARIKDEYAIAARFLFINSHMRVWYDFHFYVDARIQRWGDEPAEGPPAYRGLPLCRSYGGEDYLGPGGGTFTILNTKQVATANDKPVAEPLPFVGQIEQAFPRRWNDALKRWDFYGSGGGTYGIDGWPDGIPGRSQFLGGSDTAWLVTHEFHHQMESLGAFSLANREDDRIVFDHFAPRRRTKKADGAWDEWVWSTSWKHGEHWDGIAYFDRMLTSVQWLRLHFGETMTVADADSDGVPDRDPRLPFDEVRFGSDPGKARTDGAMLDLDKAMLSSWAPAPLTATWDKTSLRLIRPAPRKRDSDGDGWADGVDPHPLYPWLPFNWPATPVLDGDASDWAGIPLSGRATFEGGEITFRQAHDDAAYYACIELKGPWQRLSIGLDGEGEGYYTTESTYAFEILSNDGPNGAILRPSGPNRCPGLEWRAGRNGAGLVTIEISIPNRDQGLWYWQGGGREVGASISGWTVDRKPFSVYEPYDLFYARMLERHGRESLPPDAPAEIQPGPGVREYRFDQGSGPWTVGSGWSIDGGAMAYSHGPEADNQLLLTGLNATDFDILAEFEAANDFHIGAWRPATTAPSNVTDYVVFLGGFGNARSAIRADGQEVGAEETGLTSGRHRVQFTRRDGRLWALLDGKPFLHGRDHDPAAAIDRLGFLGGWDGAQRIYRVLVRLDGPKGLGP